MILQEFFKYFACNKVLPIVNVIPLSEKGPEAQSETVQGTTSALVERELPSGKNAMNLATNLESAALFFPDHPAISENGIEITYAELNYHASLVAGGLADVVSTRVIILPCARKKVTIIVAGSR
jgi:non-ribosomal peptide synthetase component F